MANICWYDNFAHMLFTRYLQFLWNLLAPSPSPGGEYEEITGRIQRRVCLRRSGQCKQDAVKRAFYGLPNHPTKTIAANT
jgi:hypothetical protein